MDKSNHTITMPRSDYDSFCVKVENMESKISHIKEVYEDKISLLQKELNDAYKGVIVVHEPTGYGYGHRTTTYRIRSSSKELDYIFNELVEQKVESLSTKLTNAEYKLSRVKQIVNTEYMYIYRQNKKRVEEIKELLNE
jgi:hypothetical protein